MLLLAYTLGGWAAVGKFMLAGLAIFAAFFILLVLGVGIVTAIDNSKRPSTTRVRPIHESHWHRSDR